MAYLKHLQYSLDTRGLLSLDNFGQSNDKKVFFFLFVFFSDILKYSDNNMKVKNTLNIHIFFVIISWRIVIFFFCIIFSKLIYILFGVKSTPVYHMGRPSGFLHFISAYVNNLFTNLVFRRFVISFLYFFFTSWFEESYFFGQRLNPVLGSENRES